METSRSLTSHRRDICHELIDDDPRRAEMLFELLAITDTSTVSGAAAHEDALRYSYSMTADCRRAMNRFLAGQCAASVVVLVGCALNFVS
jgi:hypothetical protein